MTFMLFPNVLATLAWQSVRRLKDQRVGTCISRSFNDSRAYRSIDEHCTALKQGNAQQHTAEKWEQWSDQSEQDSSHM